ncbi:MAG: T9SS type A sorting domain-containing protein, partial [Bacteroidota bacterium]
YITQMATMFRDNLNPEAKIYVEYSNELWNWLFQQAQWGESQLDQSIPWPERLAPRIAEVMQIWTDVFGAESDRLVRVVAGQHGWFDITDRIYGQMVVDGKDQLVDAISPAGYMGIDAPQLASLGAAATAQDVISGAATVTFDPNEWAMQGWYQHAQLAGQNGKQLVFYEGGQHFTPDPWGTVQPYNVALLEAQIAPEMYTLYQQLFDTLASLSVEDIQFMHFSFITPLGDQPEDARWGSFGTLNSQFFQGPPYADAPKYRAIVEHIEACETTSVASVENDLPAVQLVPNPGPAGAVTLQFSRAFTGRMTVYNAQGQVLQEAKMVNRREEMLNTSSWPGGLYFVQLKMPSEAPQIVRLVVE